MSSVADLRRPGLALLVLGAAIGGMALALRPDAARGQQHQKPEAARAREAERGQSPWHIPWLGWKDILWRTYEEIQEDRLLAVAAGVVFFGLLAFFPAITAFVSFYGLFAAPSTIRDHLDLATSVMPAGPV